jgi:hypothetical protein
MTTNYTDKDLKYKDDPYYDIRQYLSCNNALHPSLCKYFLKAFDHQMDLIFWNDKILIHHIDVILLTNGLPLGKDFNDKILIAKTHFENTHQR